MTRENMADPAAPKSRKTKKSETPSYLLSMRDMQTALSRSRQWIYNRLQSDPAFPKPVRLGDFNIAWVRAEVEQWVHNLPRYESTGLSVVDRRKMRATGERGRAAA